MSIRLCLVLVSALGLGTSVLAHEPASMPRDNPPGRELAKSCKEGQPILFHSDPASKQLVGWMELGLDLRKP